MVIANLTLISLFGYSKEPSQETVPLGTQIAKFIKIWAEYNNVHLPVSSSATIHLCGLCKE